MFQDGITKIASGNGCPCGTEWEFGSLPLFLTKFWTRVTENVGSLPTTGLKTNCLFMYLFTYLSIVYNSSVCLFICSVLICLFIHLFIDTVSNSGYTALNDRMLKEWWTEKDMGRNSHVINSGVFSSWNLSLSNM